MELRRRLDARGFGIAEAMDTAQRFFLGWPSAERLIRECGALDLEHGFIAGAGVDHLATVGSTTQLVDGVLLERLVIARLVAVGLRLTARGILRDRLLVAGSDDRLVRIGRATASENDDQGKNREQAQPANAPELGR